MLVGTKTGNISVGEVEKDHKDKVHSLVSACCTNFCHASMHLSEHKLIRSVHQEYSSVHNDCLTSGQSGLCIMTGVVLSCSRLVLCCPLQPCSNSGQVASAMQQLHLAARKHVLNLTVEHTIRVRKGS